MKITYDKEIKDTLHLASIIREDGWVDDSTIIVCCNPDFSSITSQIITHQLGGNEMRLLEMPLPTMSQILDRQEGTYQQYDRYVIDWVNRMESDYQYLFLSSSTHEPSFTKLRNVLRTRSYPYRFAAVYRDSFQPDYFVEQIYKQPFFEWQLIK